MPAAANNRFRAPVFQPYPTHAPHSPRTPLGTVPVNPNRRSGPAYSPDEDNEPTPKPGVGPYGVREGRGAGALGMENGPSSSVNQPTLAPAPLPLPTPTTTLSQLVAGPSGWQAQAHARAPALRTGPTYIYDAATSGYPSSTQSAAQMSHTASAASGALPSLQLGPSRQAPPAMTHPTSNTRNSPPRHAPEEAAMGVQTAKKTKEVKKAAKPEAKAKKTASRLNNPVDGEQGASGGAVEGHGQVVLFEGAEKKGGTYRHPRMVLLEDVKSTEIWQNTINRLDESLATRAGKSTARIKAQKKVLMDKKGLWGKVLPSNGGPGQGPCTMCYDSGRECVVPLARTVKTGQYRVAAICIGCKLSHPCDLTHANAARTNANAEHIERGQQGTAVKREMADELEGVRRNTTDLGSRRAAPKQPRGQQGVSGSAAAPAEIAEEVDADAEGEEEEGGDEVQAALRGMENFIAEMRVREMAEGPMDYGTRLIFGKVRKDMNRIREAVAVRSGPRV